MNYIETVGNAKINLTSIMLHSALTVLLQLDAVLATFGRDVLSKFVVRVLLDAHIK